MKGVVKMIVLNCLCVYSTYLKSVDISCLYYCFFFHCWLDGWHHDEFLHGRDECSLLGANSKHFGYGLLVKCGIAACGMRKVKCGMECVEYVCLPLCLSVHEDISRTTRAIFLNFVWMLPVSVARSSSSLWLRLLVTCYTCLLTTLTCLIGSILGVLGRWIYWLSVCAEGRSIRERMSLFRTAIEGIEKKLVQEIEADSSGLWTELRSRKVLRGRQISKCQKKV